MGNRTAVRKSKCTTEGIQIIAMGKDRNEISISIIRDRNVFWGLGE